MKDRDRRRERYLRDPLDRRLGGLAACLRKYPSMSVARSSSPADFCEDRGAGGGSVGGADVLVALNLAGGPKVRVSKLSWRCARNFRERRCSTSGSKPVSLETI